jgi:uncharacterized protein with PCYCGC motif
MNKKWLLVVLLVITGLIGAVGYLRQSRHGKLLVSESTTASTRSSTGSRTETSSVPAHYESPPSNLAPTLEPQKFSGKTRGAYQVVKQIPQTIAQLPCYCHCDRNMGHKSLHSCFEDDHAAHCAVCVNEALMAYRLEKQEGLSAAQIRERINAEYSKQ